MEKFQKENRENENFNHHIEVQENKIFSDLNPVSLSLASRKHFEEMLNPTIQEKIQDNKKTENIENIENTFKSELIYPIIKENNQKNKDQNIVDCNKENDYDHKKHDLSFNSEIDSNMNYIERLFNHEINLFQQNNELHILKSNKHRFNSLNQIVFNILVTGESGSGKTLFIKNFLKKVEKNIKNFKTYQKTIINNPSFSDFNVFDDEDNPIEEADIRVGIPTKKFVEYKVKNLSLTQNNKFKIIDSPGYSGTRDSQTIANKAIEYINEKNKKYYLNKRKSNEEVEDCRIHLVIYFIYGPKPRMMDYLIIKELQSHANVIPVISRGDNLGRDNILKIKAEIYNFQNNYEIEIFNVNEAVKKFCRIDNHINFLTGGKFGDCPPYYINYKNSFEENYFENIHNDDSDFIRLYFILVSYIPFDCITKTKKKFYMNYKKLQEITHSEKQISKWNYNYLMAFLAIPLFGAALTIFNKNKN